ISSSYGGTFTGGHGDIGIGYEEGQLHLHMHLGEEEPAIVNGVELSDEEFEPADVVIGISSAAQQVQSNAALAAGTGVPLGLPIWILPAEEAACLPFLGFGTEELTPEEWVGNLLLRLGRVTSPSGNGHFSIFTSDGAGGYVFLMSTADGGVTGADVLPLAAGGHEHFYLAFSESGTWQVELSAEGKHVIDGEVESDVESFAFEVGAGADPGVVTFQSAAYAVNEQASYRTVTVNRSAGSTGVLSVNYTTSDGAAIAGSDYTATSGTLVFGHGETEKGITVQIHNDTTVEPSETFSLRLTSQDATIGANSTATFTINDTPTVGAIAAQTTTIGTPTSAIPFTVADSETPAADLSVTALSSNPVLLPLSGIALGGSGASRTVTLTPVAELTGSSTVTLLVSDASGAVAIRTVTLSVGSTLAIPAAISDVVVTADESFTVNYTIANSSWVTVVTRSNTTLFNTPGTGTSSDLRTQPTSGGTSRTLRIRGSDQSTAAGVYGSSTVTLGFTGSGAPAAQTFNVRVNPRAVVDNNLLGIPGTTSTFDVLANDCIPLAGHTFTITGVSPPTHGTLEIAPGGSFLQYTPTDLTTGFDTFTYTVTVSSSDAFNGYQFSGTGYVKIGGYVVVDSPTASQHIDLDFNYVNGRWHQIIRTDAVVGGSQQSGTFSPTGLDADEGVLFFDPSTKQPRSAATSLDVLGVPAGADVWVGPSTSNGHKVYLGIANESTTGIESYTPAGDSRATSNSPWVATRLVGFSGPGHFAAFYNGVAFDTFDGLNSANDADAGGNVSDTFWGFGGSHAHLTWYFTAPGRYALTFQTTVKAGGEFVTSPPTTFYVDVDTVSGNLRLDDNPPQALPDALVVVEDGGAMSVDVIANDTSAPDGYEVLAVGAVTQGSHGATSLVGDGHSVSYTPAANFAGSDSFTYTVVDEHGGSATGTVNVTITPVNDMPTFVKGANPAHPSGTTGAQNIPNWATAITDGDADVDQALTFNVSVVSGGAIFSTPPSVSSGGSLNYVLGGTDGTAELEVTLTDDTTAGGAALTTASQSFSVTVLDQPPLISDLADASILENATLGPVSFTISDANHSAGSLNVAATSSNT
ncbi:MAG TPA: choice-of-anchor M domain-containing protein, partial [Prosthecobacter sp.]|nr:choice-of-anchor M domain-containing protein [Prosthecobacter sp.]